MRILLTGGGTGGHLTPLIAVVREIKKISQEKGLPNPEFLYVGPNSFSQEFLKKEGIKIKIILAGKLRRYFSLATILDIFKLPVGLMQAMWHLLVWMPDVIFSKGGYGSVPAVLAGWIYRVPVLLHDSDTIPGAANKFLSHFAQKIAVSFDQALNFFPDKKTALTSNPIRLEITHGMAETAKETLGIKSNKPIIFIFGGSQGAQAINETLIFTLPKLLEKYELIWQAGSQNYEAVKTAIKENLGTVPEGCHLFAFLDEKQIAQALAAAQLVVSRAGAATIFEIAACGKPSILIPLPNSAADHQKENAFEFARSGAALVIEQANLVPNLFLDELERLFNNPELLDKMSAYAKSFAKPDAARKIAEELINLTIKN